MTLLAFSLTKQQKNRPRKGDGNTATYMGSAALILFNEIYLVGCFTP